MSLSNIFGPNSFKLNINTTSDGINVNGTRLKNEQENNQYTYTLPPIPTSYDVPLVAVSTLPLNGDTVTTTWVSPTEGGVVPPNLTVDNLTVNNITVLGTTGEDKLTTIDSNLVVSGNTQLQGGNTLGSLAVNGISQFNGDITVPNNANIKNVRISNPAENNFTKLSFLGNTTINYNLPLTQTASENIPYVMTATRTGVNTQLNLVNQTLTPVIGPKGFYFTKEPISPDPYLTLLSDDNPTYTTSFRIDKLENAFYYLTLKFGCTKTSGTNFSNFVTLTDGSNIVFQSDPVDRFVMLEQTLNEPFTYNFNHVVQILNLNANNYAQINIVFTTESTGGVMGLGRIEAILTPITNVFSAVPV